MTVALRVARAVKGWSRAELSRISGVPEGSLWRYEAGSMKPSQSSLDALRVALEPELDRAELHYGSVRTRERGRGGERWAVSSRGDFPSPPRER